MSELGRGIGLTVLGAVVATVVSRVLADEPARTSATPVDPRGSVETRVQRALSALGYYRGPVDGVWTMETGQALGEFQREFNITRRPNPFLRTDGMLDVATANALDSEVEARHLDSPLLR